ncbi:MFS general substrate transporter [Schizophyllum commune Tattone D]|nr:MFS general substrate transporter [Schizophyllum commune Tattone D]
MSVGVRGSRGISQRLDFSKSDVELATRTPLPRSSSNVQITQDTNPSVDVLEASNLGSSTANVSSLPAIDGGFGAWSFLAAAFMVDTVVWGFPSAYGTLLDAYLDDPLYRSQPRATSLLALIGPIVSGVMHCSSPVINPVLYRYPKCARPLVWVGTLLCAVSLFSSSYAVTLLALQGVIYSIGGSFIYVPTIFYMSQWFVERRGMANGIMFAGTSVGGVVVPLALPPLIARFGIPTTLRIFAGAILASLVPFLPFIRGRLPEVRNQVHGPEPRNRKEWYKEESFLLLLATNTLQAFGYFVPLLWLPDDVMNTVSSLTLTLLNATSTFGRLGTGFLSDRFNPWSLAFGMLILSALSSLVLWGVLSYTFAGVIAFSAVYGVVSAGWATLWTGFIRPIAKDDPNLSTTLFGWLLLTRGLGNILSTPISTALESSSATGRTDSLDLGFDVAGGKYEKIIVYTGACFIGAALVVVLGWGVEFRKRREQRGMGI